MPVWIIGIIAAIAGILVGFSLRSFFARSEKVELAQTKSELAARAGFEALAAERQKSIDSLHAELQAKSESERLLSARVKELEAELRNERQNIAEKIALLETAKKALSDQFQALAAEILEKKSRTFSETSQAQLGTLLEPLKTQIKDFREKVEQTNTDSRTGVAELKTLIGTLGSLNQALTEEAHNLATALRRDTKMQGNWGRQSFAIFWRSRACKRACITASSKVSPR